MVDTNDVQGLVLRSYPYPRMRYLLFHCPAGSNARGFLATLLPRLETGLGTAPSGPRPDTLTNVGLTVSGLAATGLSQAGIKAFDFFFRQRPDASRTGDVAASAPANWWEKQFAPGQLDITVILHARDAAAMQVRTDEVLVDAVNLGLVELVPRRDGSRLDGESFDDPRRLHFGYRDGFSQPDVNWSGDPPKPGQIEYRSFLLGYADDKISTMPRDPAMAALARNSVYGAFRWIYQDVARFQRFLSESGSLLAERLGIPQTDAEELLAAKLMGRWRDGTPLVLSPDKPATPYTAEQNFDYTSDPTKAAHCPFAAHIRVNNPRDQTLNPPEQAQGLPRVIRRGKPYGPEMAAGQTEDDGVDRGLLGLFLCGSLNRQIYPLFKWISQTSFSPVFGPGETRRQDALVANRSFPGADTSFRFPLPDGTEFVIPQLPDFVLTKATEFLLLPSRSMLQSLIQ